MSRAAAAFLLVLATCAPAAAQVLFRGGPGATVYQRPWNEGAVPPYQCSVRAYGTPDGDAPASDGEPGVALLLTDALGQRIGVDAGSGTRLAEIPGARYERVVNENPLAPIGPRGRFGHGIVLRAPCDGRYQLDVIGTGQARYDLVVELHDATGRRLFTDLRWGGIEPGAIDRYAIVYAPAATPPIDVTDAGHLAPPGEPEPDDAPDIDDDEP